MSRSASGEGASTPPSLDAHAPAPESIPDPAPGHVRMDHPRRLRIAVSLRSIAPASETPASRAGARKSPDALSAVPQPGAQRMAQAPRPTRAATVPLSVLASGARRPILFFSRLISRAPRRDNGHFLTVPTARSVLRGCGSAAPTRHTHCVIPALTLVAKVFR